MQFSRELRNDVLARDITLTVRLWTRPQVKEGGRYRVGPGEIEVDVRVPRGRPRPLTRRGQPSAAARFSS
jgi:hypothetical protein